MNLNMQYLWLMNNCHFSLYSSYASILWYYDFFQSTNCRVGLIICTEILNVEWFFDKKNQILFRPLFQNLETRVICNFLSFFKILFFNPDL